MPENFRSYSTIDLVRYIAFAPRESRTWEHAFTEFDRRFSRLISTIVYRKCCQLQYQKGLHSIDDFLQEVYNKLLKNGCNGLKKFKGKYEKQFLKYLHITTIRIVLNAFRRDEIAPTHSPSGGLQSLDQIIENVTGEGNLNWQDIIPNPTSNEELNQNELLEEIKFCLDKTQKNNKNKERNVQAFMLWTFAGFKPDEIAEKLHIGISSKRISNLLTDIKKLVVKCLKSRIF